MLKELEEMEKLMLKQLTLQEPRPCMCAKT